MPKPETAKETSMLVVASTMLIVSGIAGKKLVENVVSDLYNLARKEAGFQLKKWKSANHTDTISKRIRQLRLVKTILQSEKEIDLTSFYHPSRIRMGDKRSIVHQLADLNVDCSVGSGIVRNWGQQELQELGPGIGARNWGQARNCRNWGHRNWGHTGIGVTGIGVRP